MESLSRLRFYYNNNIKWYTREIHIDTDMSPTRLSVRCVDADREVASEMATRLATASDIDAEGVTTATAALEAVGEIDVVVLGDGVDGMERSELIEGLSTPVVCCPANGDEALASRLLDHGATDYVPRKGAWGSALLRRVIRAARTADAEKRRRSLVVDQSPLGMIEWNREGVITGWNGAASEIFGYEPEEAIGTHGLSLLSSADEREEIGEIWTALIEGTGGGEVVSENRTREGRRVTCEWHNTALVDDGKTVGAVSFVQDITARRELRTAVHEHERKVRHLQTTAMELACVTEEMAVYRRMTEAAERVLEFDLSYVGIEIDGWIVPIVRSADAGVDGARTMSVEEGIVGETFMSGESKLIEDVESTPGVSPAQPEYRSGISVPIGDVGVFQAVACERAAFDRTDLELTELLCAHAAAVLTRITSQRDVRHERDRFAALFENVPDPVVQYRYEDGEPIVRSINPAFESIFGFDAEAPLGRSLDSLIVPREDGDRTVGINDRIATGEQLDIEVERETVTGRRTFLLRNVPLSSGETRAGYAIYTDISEQKHHQATLAALQRTTRQLISAETESEIGEQLIGTAKRVLSLPYAAVLRYRPEENVLRPIAVSERWGSLDADIVEYLTFEAGGSLTWTAFESGEAAIYEDITTEADVGRDEPKVRGAMLLPIGEWGVFLVGSTAADSFDETDLDFAGVLAASAEAAFERTARETTIREREAELARQNRRLEQFASVVSHDLRNPLTIARGRLDLARDGNPDQLERVDDALGRIESIIDDVLQLAREDTVETIECVDLATCAREAWALAETEGATLSIEENGTIRGDRNRLQRVFENLFRNCVEHGSTSNRNASRSDGMRGSFAPACQPDSPSESGDDVEHSSTGHRPAADDSAERSSTGKEGLSVRVGTFDGGFFVADDGEGIPSDEREEVFTYGHSGGDGSGLGLAIVEQIVEAHGWRVSVADSPRGARFEIRTEPSD